MIMARRDSARNKAGAKGRICPILINAISSKAYQVIGVIVNMGERFAVRPAIVLQDETGVRVIGP